MKGFLKANWKMNSKKSKYEEVFAKYLTKYLSTFAVRSTSVLSQNVLSTYYFSTLEVLNAQLCLYNTILHVKFPLATVFRFALRSVFAQRLLWVGVIACELWTLLRYQWTELGFVLWLIVFLRILIYNDSTQFSILSRSIHNASTVSIFCKIVGNYRCQKSAWN